jgi:hypothetical protein
MISIRSFIFTLACSFLFASAASAETGVGSGGVFRLQTHSHLSDLSARSFSEVEFTLTDTLNVPVTGAHIRLSGGMRAHGHGLPTRPLVQELEIGRYIVKGLKFSMPGSWELQFDIEVDEYADQVRLEFIIGDE